MKRQTIARLYIENNEVFIAFQSVSSFGFIANKFIKYKTEDEKRYYSDWVNSGDLIKAEFDSEYCDLVFDVSFRNLDFDLRSFRKNRISEHYASELTKDLNRYKRLKAKYYDKLSEIGASECSCDLAIILNVIFKLLNVVGATISTREIKYSCASAGLDYFIEQSINISQNHEQKKAV